MFHVARVSYCLESQQAQGVMVARHEHRRVMDRGELEADGRVTTRRVGVRDEAGGFESRRTGRAVGVRRVVWTRGRCDRVGARVGRE